ncbi:MAG: hypothetical protein U1F56_06720 [Rubrivivax sp.]
MNRSPRLAAALLALSATAGAQAASSAVASASDSVSTSVESISRSVRQSSRSSSPQPVAQGLYEVKHLAEVEPGVHEVVMDALPGQAPATGSLTLRLPAAAVRAGALAAGTRVQVHERPYGFELAQADTRTAFFLLLHDDWARDLITVPLGS